MQHARADGFSSLIRDLKNPAFAMQDGTSHMLNGMKDYPQGRVKKIDYTFDGSDVACTKCRFDIELNPASGNPTRFVEFKSYQLSSIIGISKNQLLEYFRAINSIDELEYVFNKLKTPDRDLVLNEFKSFFQSNITDIYQALNVRLKNQLEIDTLSDFRELINDTSSDFYSFIKAI